MDDDNGYAGGASSSDNEYTSSSPRNGPFGGEGTDDENERLEQEDGVDHEQADPADSDYMSDFMMGSGDEYEYLGDSDMDMGYDEDTVESEVITGSYSENMSEAPVNSQDEDVQHCSLNMNIDLDEDRRGRYRQIMEMFFYSEDGAYSFYNNYAKENGFSIRRDKVKRTKNSSGEVRLRRFVCSREGKRHKRYFANLGGRSQRLRAESRCNCKAHLVVKLDRQRGVWVVARFDDRHNHILAKADEVPFLWSHRKIKDFQKAEILAMGVAGVRKHMIMSNFISKYGRYIEVGFVRRDMYNMCAREKRKLIEKGDASTSLGIMLSRRDNGPDFFFEFQADEQGRLRSMFWCDSQSRQDYQDYGDVVVFDSTYKMNRYGMPFIPFVGLNSHRKTTVFGCAIVSDETEETYVWLLQTFLRAMCQKKPRVVITDGDASMIRAIGVVLTGVWHRLCSWHIEKNMKKHLSFKSTKEFRSLLYYTTSEDTFEDRWNAFVQKWRTDRTEPWLRRMYRKKRLWAASYLSGGFFLGMKSNQRSESLNSCLHLHLDFGMTLVDLIVHYENAIVRIREAEASDDCSCSQTLPVAVTDCKAIEVAAARVFTPANFYMVQADLMNIGGLQVFDVHDGDPRRFIVGWRNNRRHRFAVDYAPENSEETIKCSCRRMARKGIPCKHILYVLKVLKLDEIPQCCVLPRFSKRARHGVPARRNSDLFAWGWSGIGERTRYSELSVLGSEAFHVACNDRVLFDETKGYMKNIISKKQTGGNRFFNDKDGKKTEGTHPVIGDPVKVCTKGAPKQKTKFRAGQNSPVTKNGRPLAFDERTKPQVCSACKQPGHNIRSKVCKLHPSKADGN